MPPEILDPGIELIRYLSQYRGPWVTAVLLAFSGMGSTLGYLLLFCMLWWGVSWKLGARLFAALVLSVYLNAVIKDWVAQPRPFEYADVASVTRPDEFGFPSGHAQHAALVWNFSRRTSESAGCHSPRGVDGFLHRIFPRASRSSFSERRPWRMDPRRAILASGIPCAGTRTSSIGRTGSLSSGRCRSRSAFLSCSRSFTGRAARR